MPMQQIHEGNLINWWQQVKKIQALETRFHMQTKTQALSLTKIEQPDSALLRVQQDQCQKLASGYQLEI